MPLFPRDKLNPLTTISRDRSQPSECEGPRVGLALLSPATGYPSWDHCSQGVSHDFLFCLSRLKLSNPISNLLTNDPPSMKDKFATDANSHCHPDQLTDIIWCHQDTSYFMHVESHFRTSLWRLTQMRMDIIVPS